MNRKLRKPTSRPCIVTGKWGAKRWSSKDKTLYYADSEISVFYDLKSARKAIAATEAHGEALGIWRFDSGGVKTPGGMTTVSSFCDSPRPIPQPPKTWAMSCCESEDGMKAFRGTTVSRHGAVVCVHRGWGLHDDSIGVTRVVVYPAAALQQHASALDAAVAALADRLREHAEGNRQDAQTMAAALLESVAEEIDEIRAAARMESAA